MISLIVDANILVGIFLRPWGIDLLAHPEIDLWMTERAVSEAEHVFDKRLQALLHQKIVAPAAHAKASIDLRRFLDDYVTVVPTTIYPATALREAALRVPDDPDDQPTAALALVTGAGIWTEDRHFWGCGLPVWRTERLRAVVMRSS